MAGILNVPIVAALVRLQRLSWSRVHRDTELLNAVKAAFHPWLIQMKMTIAKTPVQNLSWPAAKQVLSTVYRLWRATY